MSTKKRWGVPAALNFGTFKTYSCCNVSVERIQTVTVQARKGAEPKLMAGMTLG